MQANCLPFKQAQSAVKIDIFNHKIRLHPTMILNIKESFKGQYTVQKPAWRDECQFLPFTNKAPRKPHQNETASPWLGVCCSGKATLQTDFSLGSRCCSEKTLRLHIPPSHGKTTAQRGLSAGTGGKEALCAAALPGDSLPGLGEAAAGFSILLSLQSGAL